VIFPGDGNVENRRRPTRRHRRNRLIRRIFAVAVVGTCAAAVASLALKYFSPSLFRAARPAPITYQEAQSRNHLLSPDDSVRPSTEDRPVYPYSVIPGGVRDARELKWFAEHDPVVAAHYAGFDYDHARVVRLELAKTVYVSYRIGNRVYWTRHRIKLRKGEKVITDGRMTARTRCANRVEEAPKQAAEAPSEPPVAQFEEPIHAGEGTAMKSPPVPFESALLNRPLMPEVEPAAPLSSLYNPFTGTNNPPVAPPPLPIAGTCVPTRPKKKSGSADSGPDSFATSPAGKKKKSNPCVSGGPESVPEPGTWLMVAAGLAGVYWQARRKLAVV
jgi:PEP-CTERM motif